MEAASWRRYICGHYTALTWLLHLGELQSLKGNNQASYFIYRGSEGVCPRVSTCKQDLNECLISIR